MLNVCMRVILQYKLTKQQSKRLQALLQHNKCHKVMCLFFHELSFTRSARLCLACHAKLHRLRTHFANQNQSDLCNRNSNILRLDDRIDQSLIEMAMVNFHKYASLNRREAIETLNNRHYCNWNHLRKTYEQGHAVTNVFKKIMSNIEKPPSYFVSPQMKQACQLNNAANKLKASNMQCILNPQANSIRQLIACLGASSLQLMYQQTHACLNCISYLHQYDRIQVPPDIKDCVHFIDDIRMPTNQIEGEERNVFEQLICSILNSRGCGYIFIGAIESSANHHHDCLDPKYLARGIEIKEAFVDHFPKQLKHLVTNFIAPQAVMKEYLDVSKFESSFQISYIPVLVNQADFQARYTPDQITQSLLSRSLKQNCDLLFQGLFIVRVKIQLKHIDPSCLFYVVTPGMSNHKAEITTFCSTSTLMKNIGVNHKNSAWGHEILTSDVYSKIMVKFRKGVKLRSRNNHRHIYSHESTINCQKPLILNEYLYRKYAINPTRFPSEAEPANKQESMADKFQRRHGDSDNLMHKSPESHTQEEGCSRLFGSIPINTFKHEVLMLVPLGKQHVHARFIIKLDELRINYNCYLIYEKLQQNANRKAYYLTHEKKYDSMLKVQESVEDSPGDILLFQVRKNFVLLNGSYEQLLSLPMVKQFKQQFKANISVGCKKSYNPEKKQLVHGVYCSFVHTMHALFAFIALENASIKCNFVNNKKLEGVLTKDI